MNIHFNAKGKASKTTAVLLQHFFHQLGLKRTDYIDLTFFSFVLHVDNIPVLEPEGAVYVIELKMITLLELHLNLSHNSRSLQY